MSKDSEEKKMRPDLQKVLDARAALLDEARPKSVEKQRKRKRWTAREGIAGLVDADSFVEYGGLARPAVDGMDGAADGLIMGTGKVNGTPVDLVVYDYTVYAGTQSAVNHPKMMRMLAHAHQHHLPVICWLDGGGARPHDMLVNNRASTSTFVTFARLSGLVPTIGILPGRAFAGHANLAGMCDVLIATKDSSMGMAGPPLVEAALGVKMTPEELGPASVHVASGVIDILVDDEAQAIAAAKKYLAYFKGPHPKAEASDQSTMREVVPESPKRAYNVRKVIEILADRDSILELKPSYGRAIVTSLIRLGGRPVGVVASQPMFLAGAIDGPASDKSSHFIQICDAFDIPVVILCDTPGLMVGPEVEKTGLVRRSARILTALANATVPIMTVVLRKAYGLGYYIMGSPPLDPALLVAWPTAEFGGMGLEGAVNILHGAELDAAPDPQARSALQAKLAEKLKAHNTALEIASRYLVDDVIDPAQTRNILLKTLETLPQPAPRTSRKRIIEPF